MLSAKTPFTEVLTVIRQEVIAILAYTGTRPANYFIGLEARCLLLVPDPERASAARQVARTRVGQGTAMTIWLPIAGEAHVTPVQTPMGGAQLTPDQASAVAAYVWSLGGGR